MQPKQEEEPPQEQHALEVVQEGLSRQQTWNIVCLVFAFSCVVASLTLIVGTGAVVIKSVGGSTTLAPFALAVFFLGMSLISLTITHWIFDKWGRKVGFWCGSAVALVGVGVACLGLVRASPALVLTANAFLGAGTGMGMYLRFAALEVVPPSYSSRAVTWTLCGGCMAAFCGPEAAHATKGLFGEEEHLTYLGVFVVAGCFYIAQAIFVGLMIFPTTRSSNNRDDKNNEDSHSNSTKGDENPAVESSPTSEPNIDCEVEFARLEDGNDRMDQDELPQGSKQVQEPPPNYGSISTLDKHTTTDNHPPTDFWSILKHSDFWIPLMIATLAWAIMAMPMSIFRVTMKELGYTERQSLTVIEFHFLAMYSPGFLSGRFIQRYGPIQAVKVAIGFFLGAMAANLASQDNNHTIVTWYLGLVCLGCGWNFGYSAATVWVAQAYRTAPHLKSKVQAANECAMFLFSGAAIFSTGYLYQSAGGGGLPGWRILNYTLLGLVGLLIAVIVVALQKKKKESSDDDGRIQNQVGTEHATNEVMTPAKLEIDNKDSV